MNAFPNRLLGRAERELDRGVQRRVPALNHYAGEPADERLYEVLAARTGISGDARLADALREGKDEYVLSVVRRG